MDSIGTSQRCCESEPRIFKEYFAFLLKNVVDEKLILWHVERYNNADIYLNSYSVHCPTPGTQHLLCTCNNEYIFCSDDHHWILVAVSLRNSGVYYLDSHPRKVDVAHISKILDRWLINYMNIDIFNYTKTTHAIMSLHTLSEHSTMPSRNNLL